MLSKLREPTNGLTHLAGAISALVGLGLLLAQPLTPPMITALVIYGISLFLMFLASSIYHLANTSPQVTAVLRKFDHAAIYLLIAGTYTPFCAIAFRGFWQWGFLAIIWSLALVGITIKIFTMHAPRWVTAGVYIIMGWLSLFAFPEILAVVPSASITWLVIGGVAYTAGAGIYITKKMDFIPGVFGFHEVWHLFVMLGAAAHFISIASLLKAPAILGLLP